LKYFIEKNVISTIFKRAELSNLTPQKIVNTGISGKLEGFLLERRMKSSFLKISQVDLFRKYGNNLIPESISPSSISGGLNLIPISDYYRYGYSILLDVTSMYPSVMIDKNICYSTLEFYGDTKEIPFEDGGLATFNQDYQGFLPSVATELLKLRKESSDVISKQYYKLLNNAMIGILNQKTSGEYFKELFLSITRGGRYILSNYVKYINQNYPEIKVIYGATDSVILHSDKILSLKDAFDLGNKLSLEQSTKIINLKLEGVFKNIMIHDKKNRYMGTFKNTLDSDWKHVVNGYDFDNKASINFIRKVCNSLCQILTNPDVDDFIKKRAEFDMLVSNTRKSLIKKNIVFGDLLKYNSDGVYVIAIRDLLFPGKDQYRWVSPLLVYNGICHIDWAYYTEKFDDVVKKTFSKFISVITISKRNRQEEEEEGITNSPPPSSFPKECKECQTNICSLYSSDIENCTNYTCSFFDQKYRFHRSLYKKKGREKE